jgi:hypothetical protein
VIVGVGRCWRLRLVGRRRLLRLRLHRIRVRGRQRLLGVRWIVHNIAIHTRIRIRIRISRTRITTVIVPGTGQAEVEDIIVDERLLPRRRLNG